MKIYKFNDFNNIDLVTIKYCEGVINESQYLQYLYGINESFVGEIKEKVVNILNSFLKKAIEAGFSIFSKFKTFFNWILNSLKKWKTNNPTLYKIIIITIIVFIILIISASSAHAATSGDPIPVNQINLAIGWLEQIQGKTDMDILEVKKAMAYLIDIRDGNLEIQNLGDEAINIAKSSLNTASKMMKAASEDLKKDDESLAKLCLELADRGANYVQATYSKIGNDVKITLSSK